MSSKRGRPRKNGLQRAWMLRRILTVVYHYDKARKNGAKHTPAMKEVVVTIRRKYKDMPISDTTVRRILAVWYPKNGSSALINAAEHFPQDQAEQRRCRTSQAATNGPVTLMNPQMRARPKTIRIAASSPNVGARHGWPRLLGLFLPSWFDNICYRNREFPRGLLFHHLPG